jgi:hypothetical protein
MRVRVWALLLTLALLAGGCATQAHRRVGEGVRLRGERIAANEEAPAEVRKDGAEVAAGMSALQNRVLPKPDTPVEGTSEELKDDIEKAGSFDTMISSVSTLGKSLLEKLASSGGVLGTIAACALGVAGWLAKRKKTIERVAEGAVETRNRVASLYREHVPDKVKAAVDKKLASIAEKYNLPPEEIANFLAWENTPD